MFRVTNRDVPYAPGLRLRGDGPIGGARLPGTSGGGPVAASSRDCEIELVFGSYV